MDYIFLLTVLIIYFTYKLFIQLKTRKYTKKRNAYLKTLNKFELKLDSINIDGFHWQENIPVDMYDNELDPNTSFFYRTTSYHSFSFKNKFYKQKDTTKFKTKLSIPINYLDTEYKFHVNLPIEHTRVRMKFYSKKHTTVYVEKIKKEDLSGKFRFLLDFRFLNKKNISIVSTKLLNKVKPIN